MANNLLTVFPFEVAENLPALTWFTLRGNHIESIPKTPFRYFKNSSMIVVIIVNSCILLIPIQEDRNQILFFSHPKRLDKLDLGENFITSLSPNMFNGTLAVNDLNLDHNYIEALGADAFRSITPRRIYLGTNRISTVQPNAFRGVEQVK